jgi:hypothetical protein
MPTSRACSARAAARPRSCRCRGLARAAVSRCCSRRWACPCAASCPCARPPPRCASRPSGCGGGSAITFTVHALGMTCRGVRYVGIDETSVKRGHAYITVVHDLEAKRPAVRHARARPRDPAGLCPGPARARWRAGADRARLHRHERGLRQGDCPGAAHGAGQLRPFPRRGPGQYGDGRGSPRGDAQRRSRGPRGGRYGKQEDAAPAVVGDAQEPAAMDAGTVRRDELAAALGPQECAGVADEAGPAARLPRGGGEQLRRGRPRGLDEVDQLGPTLSPGTLQAARRHGQGASGRRAPRPCSTGAATPTSRR